MKFWLSTWATCIGREDLFKATYIGCLITLSNYICTFWAYGRFVLNLATVAYSLNQLLCKDIKWLWNKDSHKVFSSLKKQLAFKAALVHYDVNFTVRLAYDPSLYGLRIVIFHTMSDHSKRLKHVPLNRYPKQKNHLQIEKEALSTGYILSYQVS